MKILLVIDHFGSGGAQRQIVTLAVGLKSRGYNVEFFVYHPEKGHFREIIEAAEIKVHQYNKRHRFSLSVLLVLRKLIKKMNYDIVLSFLSTPNCYSELSMISIPNTKLIVSERSVYSSLKLSLGKRSLQQFHRIADQIVVNSHFQRKLMEAKHPWMKEKIVTIYNGIDLDTFHFTPIKQDKQLTLLVIGTIVPNKNAEGLIRALARYKDRYNEVPMIRWAGKQHYKIENQLYYQKMNELINNLKIREHWEWLGERSDIPELISAHDALIHPSFYEGLPNAICEALASGRPVIASNVCEHPKLVAEKERGFLFDPSDSNSICKAIHAYSTLVQSDKICMSIHSRKYAEKQLSVNSLVSNYEKLFQKLMYKNQKNYKKEN